VSYNRLQSLNETKINLVFHRRMGIKVEQCATKQARPDLRTAAQLAVNALYSSCSITTPGKRQKAEQDLQSERTCTCEVASASLFHTSWRERRTEPQSTIPSLLEHKLAPPKTRNLTAELNQASIKTANLSHPLRSPR